MTDKSIYAWHFSTDELDFDMKGTKVEAGLTVSMDDIPVLQFKGFHACTRPLDALSYFAQRPNLNNLIIVSRVRLTGQTIDDTPAETEFILSEDEYIEIESPVERLTVPINMVAQKREHLWTADAKSIVEAFGVWCYEETLRLLRRKNYIVSTIFDDAIKARQENSDNLSTLAKSTLDEAEASGIELIKPVLERLSASLTMNTIDFALAYMRTFDYGNRIWFFDGDEKVSAQELSNAYYDLWQANHVKFHEMLMQLAPEGYHEP